MLPQPAHLGRPYAEQFGDASVVEAYHLRVPYPPALFPILTNLVATTPRTVLDAGCGTGELARALASRVDRVDAVDLAPAMVACGRTLPGGDHPHLRWIVGAIEEVPLAPPYALITVGASLHWMAWDMVLPRFASLLAPRGCLALVDTVQVPLPWASSLSEIITRYSTNREYRPYDLVAELVQRDLFHPAGETTTRPLLFRQPIAGYVESFHAMNGFSRDRMAAAAAQAFDAAVELLLRPFCPDGLVTLQVSARVVWGRPMPAGWTRA